MSRYKSSSTTLVTPMDASYRSKRLPPKEIVYPQERIVKRALNNENTPPQDEPRAKRLKYRTTFQEVTIKKKPLEYKHDTDVPHDYKLVKYGRKDVTNFLLNLSRKHGLPVWIARSTIQSGRPEHVINDPARSGYHVGRVGYYFQADAVAKAEKWFEIRFDGGEIKSDEKAHRPQVTKNDLQTCLDEIYPNIPERDRKTITGRLNPRKGTAIGRASGMNPYKQVELAVISHIRHSFTDYDKMLLYGDKNSARQMVQPELLAKLAEWKGEDAKDEYETEFREVVDLVDEPEEIEKSDDDDEHYSPPLPPNWFEPRRSAEEHTVPSRPSTRHPDVDRLNPPLVPNTASPARFGSPALEGFRFQYRPLSPWQPGTNLAHPSAARQGDTSNVPIMESRRRSWDDTRPPLPHISHPPPQHGRVVLKPLGQSERYQGLPPPPTQPGQSSHQRTPPLPWHHSNELLATQRGVLPPPGMWAGRTPTTAAHPSTHRPSANAPPPSMDDFRPATVPQPPIHWRPLPPVAQPLHWRPKQSEDGNLPALPPQMRYRPLSPEDVLPSMEAHSPPQHNAHWDGRHRIWGNYASPQPQN